MIETLIVAAGVGLFAIVAGVFLLLLPIPIKYNLRNLRERWITTTMTIVGIALVTGNFVGWFALMTGISHALVGTGNPLNMIVLRPGATETQSGVTRQQAADIGSREGIVMASPELVVVANLLKPNGKKANVAIRGVGPLGRDIRGNVKIVEGRWFNPSLGEIVVGRTMQGRFADLKVGDKPFIRGRNWTVVGAFTAEGQAYESEIWADVEDLMTQFKREYSSLIARCATVDDVKRIGEALKKDRQIRLEGKPHSDYYRDQNMMAMMIQSLGVVMAVVLMIGSVFGAANTMYAAVANRSREVATMRVLGYTRFSIWISFMLESAFLGCLGGLLGSVGAWLLVDGMTTGTANWATFSELAFKFRVTPLLMAIGTVLAMGVGMVGGLLPAFRASRVTIAAALRGL